MWKQAVGVLAVCVATVCGEIAARAGEPVTPATLTDERVVQSLTKGLDFLFTKRENGVWENDVFDHAGKKYSGGHTALVLYTLLTVNESLKDPRLNPKGKDLEPAIELVKKIDTDLVYLKAMQIMALSKLKPDADGNKQLNASARPLLAGMAPAGGYLYRLSETAGKTKLSDWDNSSTQMALLAAWGLADRKVEVPTPYWQTHDRYWRAKQNADGGWGYANSNKDWITSTPSMSSAGVASLFVLKDVLSPNVRLTSLPDKPVDLGLAWMDKNLDAERAFEPGWPSGYFTLFSMQRVALASGRKTIGGRDWYRGGAVALLKRQREDGSWPEQYYYHDTKGDVVTTCFSLIFLARGRNPVAFNKLEYPGNTWDARPRDAANATEWMSKTFERAINWQTVKVDEDVAGWLDAPILLITGSVDPKFNDAQIDQLKKFVHAGGIIFSTTDGAGPAFTAALAKCVVRVTGEEFRELPADHLVFGTYNKLKSPLKLLGASNGAREMWIHSPIDLGATWQGRRNSMADHFIQTTNIYFYAAGSSTLQPRLKGLQVPATDKRPEKKAAITRIDFGPGSDPEPGAWPRLAKSLRAKGVVDLEIASAKPEELDVAKTKLAHLTAARPFALDAPAVTALQAFLEKGGTLFIDNTGGSQAVDASVQALIKLLAKDPLAPAPPDAPWITGTAPGAEKIDALSVRRGIGRSNVGDISSVTIGGRTAVIYSPMDVTSGLLGTTTAGISGYEPAACEALVRNLLMLYATKSAPATAPASASKP